MSTPTIKQRIRKAINFVTSFWPLDIFKFFTDKKRHNSFTLNLIGVQPFRVWLANRLQKKRKEKFLSEPVTPYAADLDQKGFLKLENFVTSDFDALKQECKRAFEEHPEGRTQHQGGAIYRKVPLRLDNLDGYPNLKKYIQNDFLKAITEYNQGGQITLPEMNIILHRVVTDQEADKDENQDMHVDTFHSTTKGWLYLDDVELKDGPLTYLKGSNVIDKWRLKFEYKNSLKFDSAGSWRISNEDSEEVFGPEQKFTVPENTLVIADTMGFHRRGDAEKGVSRDTIHFSARKSPFFER